jgi:hypothetical protein
MSRHVPPRAHLLILLVLGALACNNDPTIPAPAEPGPTYRTAQNPEGPGALVIRFQDIMGFLFAFEDPALTILTGLTLDQLDVLCSGGEPVFEPADVQLVFLPNENASHEVFKARNFSVLVFEGFFADFCAVPPFAVGEGDFTSTDGGPFTSRIAFIESSLRARVFEESGEQHHLLIRLHFLFDRLTGETRKSSEDIEFN